MNKETIAIVQQSWVKVVSIAPKAPELFYQNLFAADPTLQRLFKGNMTEQGKNLMQMIGAAVGNLNDLDGLIPVLHSLGKRHAVCGVNQSITKPWEVPCSRPWRRVWVRALPRP